MKKILITCVLIGFGFGVNAQGLFSPRKIADDYTTVSVGGGSSHYFGDLAPYGYFYHGLYTNVRWNATVNYARHFNSRFGVRAAFTWARIAGDDFTFAQRSLDDLWLNYVRNFHFRNDVKEFTISGIFNLLPQYSQGARGRKKVMPFATAGIGFYAHNPQATSPVTNLGEKGTWQNLREKRTAGQGLPTSTAGEPYSLVQLVMPLSLGMRYNLNKSWDISIEGGLRLTPFDYLDDVGDDPFFDPTQIAAFGGGAETFAQRSVESVHSRTGKDRLPVLNDIYNNPVNVQNQGVSGSVPAVFDQVVGYQAAANNALLRRGSGRVDSYILTQLTLTYIISNKVKCPPIR